MRSGKLVDLKEVVLIFKGAEFYINTNIDLLSIDCLELPLPVEEFNDGVIWKLRVNGYNEEEGELLSEVIDYNFPLSKVTENQQVSFYFSGIEKIKFRTLDTNCFLSAVSLKPQPLLETEEGDNKRKVQVLPEYIILKTMKVSLGKIKFSFGSVSFPLFIEELNQEIIFEILNPDIRPQFAAIRDYFAKALKKKLITVEVVIKYTDNLIISSTAKSQDVDSINNQMIDSIRFEFVKQEFFKGKGRTDDNPVHTMEDLLNSYGEAKKLFSSEAELIDDILNIKNSRHFLQLKYLSSKHEASVLKLRFVLQPFSFLFLIAGEKKYHIIWETLDSEDATYIWHADKTRESLRIKLGEIEIILKDIKLKGRQSFLETEHDNFIRVVHDYSDAKKGFVSWKGVLEEKLI